MRSARTAPMLHLHALKRNLIPMATPHESSHDWLSTTPRKHAYFDPTHFDHRTAIEAFSAGLGPMKAMALSQMEVATLASRRTQAYMTIPTRLARCRSRQDLVEEQLRFWQTAIEQYQESTSRIFQAWSDIWGFQPFQPAAASAPGRSHDSERNGLIHLPTVQRQRSRDGGDSRREPPVKGR